MKSQRDNAVLQLKSLIELLQRADEELKMANDEGRAIKSVIVNCKDVNIGSTEWQMVNGNKKWKSNMKRGIEKPQQITTFINQFAVLSEITSDCVIKQKQFKRSNKQQIRRNRMELGEK
jgi:hypothetical protein